MQLSFFDVLSPTPILRPVQADGEVIKGPIDVTLRLPHPRLAWDMARIEIHQHDDGLWMWAVHTACGGYRVGPKWGKFAHTLSDARTLAAQELLDKTDAMIARPNGIVITLAQMHLVRAWAEGLL